MTGPEEKPARAAAPKATSRTRRASTAAKPKPRTRTRAATTKPKPASAPTTPAAAATARPKPVAKPKASATKAAAKPKATPTKAARTPKAAAVPQVAVEAAGGFALYFVRHADAGDPATWVGDDADRPLSKKGRRQARRLARLLEDLDVSADAVLTSSKLRAADTAKVIGRAVGNKAVTDERLTLDFGREELSALVAGLGADARSAILVGHDPDFSTAVSWLVGAQLTLRKGALALVDLPDRDVAAGRGSLRWLLPPDAISG